MDPQTKTETVVNKNKKKEINLDNVIQTFNRYFFKINKINYFESSEEFISKQKKLNNSNTTFEICRKFSFIDSLGKKNTLNRICLLKR